MNFIFCKLAKKPQKTWISFFASSKTSKNMNLIFCKLTSLRGAHGVGRGAGAPLGLTVLKMDTLASRRGRAMWIGVTVASDVLIMKKKCIMKKMFSIHFIFLMHFCFFFCILNVWRNTCIPALQYSLHNWPGGGPAPCACEYSFVMTIRYKIHFAANISINDRMYLYSMFDFHRT